MTKTLKQAPAATPQVDKRENLGQIFTHDDTVAFMLSLRQNKDPKTTLEPSCGDGAFSNKLPGCTAIEFDPAVRPNYALLMDFFAFPPWKFRTQMANPPYVKGKSILPATRALIAHNSLLFHEKTNLYVYFFEKMVRDHMDGIGSEIIIIIPRDFLKATSAAIFNQYLYMHGTITHYYDHGDKKMFKDASPNTCIIRFEYGNFSRKTVTNDGIRRFILDNGQLLFLKDNYAIPFSDLFDVRVGGVTGLDEIFVKPEGNKAFVYSATRTTGQTRKMFYYGKGKVPAQLAAHKDVLIKRKIKTFTEDDWWMWGRDYHHSTDKRIYVNCKTRQADPFFCHPCNDYDGAVLALFLKDQKQDPKALCEALNKVDWNELGFKCGDRFLFSQRSLENIKLPEAFTRFIKK
jgi:adenine-specific DNA-methyltransferase